MSTNAIMICLGLLTLAACASDVTELGEYNSLGLLGD